MIWVRPDLAALFAGLVFEDYLVLGERTVKESADGSRRTAAFERGGRRFFVKTHAGVGWGEIAKNWLQGKRAIVDAGTEARALARCAELGIPVPRLAAYGVSGASAAARRSFVVTEELEGAERLSALLADGAGAAPAFRHALARALGTLVARMHAAHLGHQDLYLEHVFLRRGPGAHHDAFELFLLDLHRALPRSPARDGWRLKDLCALHGSAARHGAARGDAARFLAAYLGSGALAAGERALWRRCERRARQRRRASRARGS
jgi:heptose I phosphotransferase